MTGIEDQKAALRRHVRAELKKLSAVDRASASTHACSRLQQERVWREARTVLLYAPLGDELDIRPLLRDALASGKILALPRFDPETQTYLAGRVGDVTRDLRPGPFGVAEPGENCPATALNQLDFVLAPGVAFGLDGRRLGRGKGFYDRLLSSVRGIKCGIGFDEQVMDVIPAEPHDVCLDYILTPTRWLGSSPCVVLK